MYRVRAATSKKPFPCEGLAQNFPVIGLICMLRDNAGEIEPKASQVPVHGPGPGHCSLHSLCEDSRTPGAAMAFFIWRIYAFKYRTKLAKEM